MPIPAIAIRKMIEFGLSAEQVADLCDAIDVGQSPSPVSGAARRQRAYRERKKAKGVTRDVTIVNNEFVTNRNGVTPSRVEDNNPTILFSDESSNSVNVTLVEKSEKSSPKRGFRLPPNWEPSSALVAYAAGHGFVNGQCFRQVEKFKNYYESKSGATAIRLDWDKAFRNWILNAEDRCEGTKGIHNGQRIDPATAKQLAREQNYADAFEGFNIAVERRRSGSGGA